MHPLQKLLDKATKVGLLSPIGANPVKMRTSLYANVAVLFLQPIALDVSNLQQLLDHFGKATGLCTNFTKSEIFPIRCDNIDIPQVLGEFQAKRGGGSSPVATSNFLFNLADSNEQMSK
jgi:hypothetical protein